MNTDEKSAAMHVDAGGYKHVHKLIGFAHEWEKAGHEVDLVEISANADGGAMSAVVDGVVIFAEVHGS